MPNQSPRKNQRVKDSNAIPETTEPQHTSTGGRSARLWLLALLLIAALTAGGALTVKHQLESLQGSLHEAATSWTGAEIQFASLAVKDLRGFRVDNFSIQLDTPGGLAVSADIPELTVFVNVWDLFSGEFTVERVVTDNAAFRVRRPEGSTWKPEATTGNGPRLPEVLSDGFVLTGNRSSIEFADGATKRSLTISPLDFNFTTLPDGGGIYGRLQGHFQQRRAKPVQATGLFRSLGSFFLQAQCDNLDAADVHALFPASAKYLKGGRISPKVRIDAFPGNPIVLHVDAPFERFLLQDQPAFLTSSSGHATVLAQYHPERAELDISTARASTGQLRGDLEGIISFKEAQPRLDVRVQAKEFPLLPMLNPALGERVAKYGDLTLSLDESSNVDIRLEGLLEAPEVTVQANVAGGNLEFMPRNDQFPECTLALGQSELNWDSTSGVGEARFQITDGTASHPDFGLEASGLRGVASFQEDQAAFEQITFICTGQPFMASASYDLKEESGRFSVDGTLANVEETPLHEAIRKSRLSGSIAVDASGTFSKGTIQSDARIDCTQAQVLYNWWFVKPPGIGARSELQITYKNGQSVNVDAVTELASSKLDSTLRWEDQANGWQLQEVYSTSDRIELSPLGGCLRLPYQITGGTATGGRHHWKWVGPDKNDWEAEFGCTIDAIDLLAEGAEYPIHLEGVTTEGTLKQKPEPTGQTLVHAKSARFPPFGNTWFAPLNREAPIFDEFPPAGRDWSLDLATQQIEIPPWKGTAFTGDAYITPAKSGLNSYEATVADGKISGDYHSVRADNYYSTANRWTNVPSRYFLEHLKLPAIFSGNMTGEVHYAIDKDDPSTRQGQGMFEIADGKFSADYLITRLEGAEGNSGTSLLPPSLRFSTLSADVEFDGDTIATPSLRLVSEGLDITGTGEFVLDGDMNYDINVAVSPDTAQNIPGLRDAFNLQGHRVAQQDLALAFRVTGPTFNPRGELAELPPLSVTLVSGALEITSEVTRVIDLPRKILVDLLKLGGGIMGATR